MIPWQVAFCVHKMRNLREGKSYKKNSNELKK